MNILITGGSGFIGMHLIDKLKKKHKVTCITRKKLNIPGVNVVQGDILTMNLDPVLKNQDIIINAAGQLVGDKEDLAKTNIQATKRLFEALKNQKQIIHLSTAGVLGPTKIKSQIPNEFSDYNPTTEYERSKVEGEKIAKSYMNRFNITIVRPEFIYGPGDYHVLNLFKSIKLGKFAYIGSGKNRLYPTYIEDLTQAIVLVIANKKAFGKTYNIGGPSLVSLKDFVFEASKILEVKEPRIHIPKFIALLALPFFKIIGSKFLTMSRIQFFTDSHGCEIKEIVKLGYKPRVNYKEGLKRTIEWYKKEGLL